MKIQFRASLWMVVLATMIEIAMYFILYGLNAVDTSALRYAMKYVLTPFTANLLLLLISDLTLHSKKCSDSRKIYTVSISAALCCFVLYTVHCIFPAVYLIFTIPMAFTIVYASRRLTSLVCLICIGGKAVSDLLLFWDRDKQSIFSTQMSGINFFLSLLFLLIFYDICLLLIRIERTKNNFSIELERERQRLREEATTDSLTGIGNRQALREAFHKMENRCRRYMFAMIDLDDFKSLNDTYGHTCGDNYLIVIGRELRKMEIQNATPFRFGGDEFCILFEDGIPADVKAACKDLQDRFLVEQQREGYPCQVTMSVGIADYRFGEKPFELLQRADNALYRSKQHKGCIYFAKEE